MTRGQSGTGPRRWRCHAAVALAVALGVALAPAAVLADDGELVWGGAAPLTGMYAQAGTLGIVGMEAYVGYLNATGGINGRPVRMVLHDSGSVPEQALAVFKQIMAEEENVVAFYGDSTTFIKLSAPEVNDRYQILMGGSSMATELADPDQYPYHFMTGPTYADMIGMLLEHIAAEREGAAAPRVVLFYSNIDFGLDPIPASRERAERLGIDIVEEIETAPMGVDVAPAVLKLRRANPDYVIFHGYATTVWPEVMKQALQSGVNAMFMGTFWAMEPLIIRQTGAARRPLPGRLPLPLLLGAGRLGDPAADEAGDQAGIPAHLRPAGLVLRDDHARGDQAHAGRRHGAYRREPQGDARRHRGLGHRRTDRRPGELQERFHPGGQDLPGQLRHRTDGPGLGLDCTRRLTAA